MYVCFFFFFANTYSDVVSSFAGQWGSCLFFAHISWSAFLALLLALLFSLAIPEWMYICARLFSFSLQQEGFSLRTFKVLMGLSIFSSSSYLNLDTLISSSSHMGKGFYTQLIKSVTWATFDGRGDEKVRLHVCMYVRMCGFCGSFHGDGMHG